MNSTRALCLLTTWAVVVLVCKGASVAPHPRGLGPSDVHLLPRPGTGYSRSGSRTTRHPPRASFPRLLCWQCIPEPPSRATPSSGSPRFAWRRTAAPPSSLCAPSGAPVRRVVEPRVVFEDDPRAPLSRTRINKWLAIHPNLELLEASRDEELRALGPAFAVFSGIYGAAVKARALRWLGEMTTHEHVWVLEPDVVYTGESWKDFFQAIRRRIPRT